MKAMRRPDRGFSTERATVRAIGGCENVAAVDGTIVVYVDSFSVVARGRVTAVWQA